MQLCKAAAPNTVLTHRTQGKAVKEQEPGVKLYSWWEFKNHFSNRHYRVFCHICCFQVWFASPCSTWRTIVHEITTGVILTTTPPPSTCQCWVTGFTHSTYILLCKAENVSLCNWATRAHNIKDVFFVRMLPEQTDGRRWALPSSRPSCLPSNAGKERFTAAALEKKLPATSGYAWRQGMVGGDSG